jgi:hypothetical protein
MAFIGNIATWSSIWRVIGEHPAMSSIGWDRVCCALLEMAAAGRADTLFLAAVFSLGGVAGAFEVWDLRNEVRCLIYSQEGCL